MSDENTQASQSEAYQQQPQTQDFPPYQPPLGYPGQPQWAVAPPVPPTVTRLSLRDHLLVALSIVLALVLVLGLPAVLGFMWMNNSVEFSVRSAGAGAGAGSDAAAAASSQGVDLREAGVFVQSNDGKANEVVAYARGQDGKLREVGRYATGGTGSGSFEDGAQGLVLGTSEGETSPIHNIDKAELLFATNAGSSTISVFKVNADGLELVQKVPSGGQKPMSLTVNRGLLYVLNSGEFDNRFILTPESMLDNCAHGQLPSITGFRVSADGTLTKIDGSTRLLSGAAESGCVQVSFTPDGKTIVVTERVAGRPGPEPPGGTSKGAITTFPVRQDGTLGPKSTIEPSGNGPFGFTFTKDGALLTTEQNGAFDNPGGGQVASYAPGPDGALRAVGQSVDSLTTDPCWVVLTNDQKYAFVSSVAGTISAFTVAPDSSLTLLHPAASAPDGRTDEADNTGAGVTDLALSRDSKYLYQLNSLQGLLYVFQINENGTLGLIEQHEVFDLLPIDVGGQGAPFGISAF